MNFSMKKSVIGLAGGLFIAAQASAMPFINWDWTLDAAWTDYNPKNQDSGVFATGPVAGFGGNGFDTLTWGKPAPADQGGNGNPSSVVITNPSLDSTTNADTIVLLDQGDGTWAGKVEGTKFIHNNNVITDASSWLTDLKLSEIFKIGPQGLGYGPAVTPSFDLRFLETVNQEDIADCPAFQESATACDDVFIVLNPGGLSFEFQIGDGYVYGLSVTNEGLQDVDLLTCAFFGGNPDCQGLITDEGNSNEFQFFINLTARKISEPSILALMGLGLLGLGFRRRQNRK